MKFHISFRIIIAILLIAVAFYLGVVGINYAAEVTTIEKVVYIYPIIIISSFAGTVLWSKMRDKFEEDKG